MTNAVYGYAGWAGARWYSKEVAESAAALGRETINRAISLAKNLGLTVFYGDTDSLFVNNDEKLVQKFQAEVDRQLGSKSTYPKSTRGYYLQRPRKNTRA